MRKENWCPAMATSAWSLHLFSTSAWVFSGDSGFLPHPKGVHARWMACLQCPGLEWVWCFCDIPCDEGLPVQVWFLPCTLSRQDRLWPPWPWTKISRLENHEFTCSYSFFLKCMYKSHLFLCLILEVSFIYKFGDVLWPEIWCLYQLAHKIGFIICHVS